MSENEEKVIYSRIVTCSLLDITSISRSKGNTLSARVIALKHYCQLVLIQNDSLFHCFINGINCTIHSLLRLHYCFSTLHLFFSISYFFPTIKLNFLLDSLPLQTPFFMSTLIFTYYSNNLNWWKLMCDMLPRFYEYFQVLHLWFCCITTQCPSKVDCI